MMALPKRIPRPNRRLLTHDLDGSDLPDEGTTADLLAQVLDGLKRLSPEP